MKENLLSKWLYQNRCFLSKDDLRPFTHLCLDGGRLCIDSEKMCDFLKKFADGKSKDEKYYICEAPTPVVRMYCDFDFIEDREITLDEVKEFVKILHNTVEFYYKDVYPITVCMSPSKKVTKNKRKKIKTGVHLIWDELFVNQNQAFCLSKVFIDDLKKKYQDFEWDEIVDGQVYINGLRMVGSGKVTNKKKKNIEGKYDIIKIDEGRIYKPVWVYPEENVFDFNDWKMVLFKTIIRTFNNEKELAPIEKLPVFELKVKSNTKNKTKKENNINDNVFDRVEKFIRHQTLPQWDSPLRQLKKQGKFYIAQIDSNYCLNIERDHNSVGIYFQITETGMYQRCFCRCETLEGRINGLCSKFKSKVFILPLEVKKMLFGNSKKRNSYKKLRSETSQIDTFCSNLNLQNNNKQIKNYLKMSYNTILEIERKCW